MDRPRVNLLVSCSSRKTRPVSERLRLGSVAGTGATRVRTWVRRLSSTHEESLAAQALYAGDHWAVARSCCSSITSSWETNLWVSSAGYGLITADAPIAPYSATFSAGHTDSVSPRKSTHLLQEWWRDIGTWEGPQPGVVRSIEDLALESPGDPLVVAASSDYLAAMEQDILRARSRLDSPDLLLVISPRMSRRSPLAANLVPADARFQQVVGGALASLNVRVARFLLEHSAGDELRYSKVVRELPRLLPADPPPSKVRRRPSPDEEVAAFIGQKRRESSECSRTRLLTLFRASGHACEQSRFADIYNEVEGQER